jgi:hypothetical protein
MRVEAKKGSNASKAVAKADLPSKICVVCQRPFTWWGHRLSHVSKVLMNAAHKDRLCLFLGRRKKWEQCWEDVK